MTTGIENLPQPLARAHLRDIPRLSALLPQVLRGAPSLHFQRPHRPSDRDLRIMELFADVAGEAVTRPGLWVMGRMTASFAGRAVGERP